MGITLELKEFASQNDFAAPVVMSQCNGYTGYYRRAADYEKAPAGKFKGMAMYENAMAIFGHDFGETISRRGKALICRVRFR